MGDKPGFVVGVAGLDARDLRLIEIVFRHSQYNRYEFSLAAAAADRRCDVLIANPASREGRAAVADLRAADRAAPVVVVLPRGVESDERHAIAADRLTLQLLPMLNRVVELDLAGARPGARPGSDDAPAQAAAPRRTESSDASESSASSGTAPPRQAEAPAPTQPSVERGPQSEVPARPVEAAARSAESHPRAAEDPARANGLLPARPPEARPGAPDAPSKPSPARERAAESSPARDAKRSNLLAFPMGTLGPGAVTARLRVLVVDDSPTVRRQLTIAFDRLGLGCEAVASAADAIEKLADEHFDLALVDVVMPDADGYKLTREIKRDRRLRGMPVIILTSRSSPFDLARGALSGCDAYLTKPVPFRALETAVVRQLRKSLAIDDLTGLMRPGGSPPAPSADARPESRIRRFFRR